MLFLPTSIEVTLCKKLFLCSLQAVRLKEKGIASEIIAVSCGPAKSEVIIALCLLRNDMKFIGVQKKKKKNHVAPIIIVLRVDSAIYWINHYPMDNCYQN